MTKLQIAIKRIEDAILNAGAVLEQLEKVGKEAQKPEPHTWEHGDVFKLRKHTLIYLKPEHAEAEVFYIGGGNLGVIAGCPVVDYLEDNDAVFLFNIKEKIE